jgi:hypothetical protein
VTGQVVRDGTPVGAGVVLELEIEGETVATTTTDADGRYAFELASLPGEFSVVFAQSWNTHIYIDDQVASWAWLDGTALSSASTVEVIDLEVGLQSFGQDNPPDGKTFSAGQISTSPIVFEWTPYPDAEWYWVDLGREGETTPVWKSILVHSPPASPSASFNGVLKDGTHITAGTYWWNIGAQKNIGIIYKMTVYGHPRSLIIEP